MESIFLEILRTAPTTGLVLVVLWYGQSKILDALSKVSRRMDCFEQSQHICQLDIAKNYATKGDLCDVEQKVSDHDRRITRLESRP